MYRGQEGCEAVEGQEGCKAVEGQDGRSPCDQRCGAGGSDTHDSRPEHGREVWGSMRRREQGRVGETNVYREEHQEEERVKQGRTGAWQGLCTVVRGGLWWWPPMVPPPQVLRLQYEPLTEALSLPCSCPCSHLPYSCPCSHLHCSGRLE